MASPEENDESRQGTAALVLAPGLGAGTAYGAGMVMQRHDQRTVAGSDHRSAPPPTPRHRRDARHRRRPRRRHAADAI